MHIFTNNKFRTAVWVIDRTGLDSIMEATNQKELLASIKNSIDAALLDGKTVLKGQVNTANTVKQVIDLVDQKFPGNTELEKKINDILAPHRMINNRRGVRLERNVLSNLNTDIITPHPNSTIGGNVISPPPAPAPAPAPRPRAGDVIKELKEVTGAQDSSLVKNESVVSANVRIMFYAVKKVTGNSGKADDEFAKDKNAMYVINKLIEGEVGDTLQSLGDQYILDNKDKLTEFLAEELKEKGHKSKNLMKLGGYTISEDGIKEIIREFQERFEEFKLGKGRIVIKMFEGLLSEFTLKDRETMAGIHPEQFNALTQEGWIGARRDNSDIQANYRANLISNIFYNPTKREFSARPEKFFTNKDGTEITRPELGARSKDLKALEEKYEALIKACEKVREPSASVGRG